ncbi:protein kinase domain-containing protein [Nocardioides sambongensis]|uniref:protein kinase domain-containing protein n=1 Tax=Nocardioides sambongensis TaxID=2589074 RepID=UPI0015E84977|nr:serine/threonine protein kinase [Nocardioides sambongensis]
MVLAEGVEVDLGPLGRAWVSSLLGQGGQGYVYEVRRSTGEPLALKWYKPDSATAVQYDEMQRLVEIGSPHLRFLWPLSMARVAAMPSFGYVMQLRDPRYLELSYLLLNRDPDGHPLEVSFGAVFELCRQLAYSFLRLHARGLCYRDISFGNVFFNPTTGDVLICDNDNVGVDDGTGRVLGTPYFMAPEVVRDLTYRTLPSTDTDRHSLAVLMFYALFLGHPLEGARTDHGLRDAAWLMTHFGTDPVFCLHPDRADNRPSPIVRQYWDLYPPFLRDLFVQAFVDGLADPGARVTEGQWVKAMDRLRDSMLTCPTCRMTNFWSADTPTVRCWQDGTELRPDYLLAVGRRTLAVGPQTVLRADHLVTGIDQPTVLGVVEQHPERADRWGLRNASAYSWAVTFAEGQSFLLQPGRTMELVDGARIQVRDATVRVRRGGAAPMWVGAEEE